MNKEFIKKFAKIQQELKAPKNQFNKFGNYNYRNCEDIQEAAKPLLGDMVLLVGDDIVLVGDRHYVKATATVTDGENSIANTAYARESLIKKGMDDSQITGSASSYARKYALNGLFAIDDTKDADSMNNLSSGTQKTPPNIAKAIKSNDVQWVRNNWQGEIAEYWSNLTPTVTNKLTEMANSNG